MDYEKKYNEALKWMREIYPTLTGADKEDAEHYFPELGGSEDERIRKQLIEDIKMGRRHGITFTDSAAEEYIAWLERQKKRKIKFKSEELQEERRRGIQCVLDCPEAYGLQKKDDEPMCDELSEEIERISKRYPEISFAKLSRIAVHFAKWKKDVFTHHEPDESLIEAVNRQMEDDGDVDDFVRRGIDWFKDWLEKQKEPAPIPDKFSGLKLLMLQYLQSVANRKDDTEIESDTDLWGRKILDYVWKYDGEPKEQKPAEWSEEDEGIRKSIIARLKALIQYETQYLPKAYMEREISWLKSLRPQPKKELSIEKAIQWLDDTFYFLDNSSGRGRDCEITTHDFDSLEEMYDSFRKAVTVDSQPSWKPSEEQLAEALVARGADGSLILYIDSDHKMKLPSEMFPELTWGGEKNLIKVELIIRPL